MQQVLAASVALLGAQLRGVGAAVQLQVQLTVPHRGIRILGPGPFEELLGGAELDPGRTLQIGGAAPGGHHLAGGSAAAVAPAEQVDPDRRAALLLEVALEVGELGPGQRPVVGIGRREVGEDAGAVDALPAEGVVGEGVGLIPGDLLGQEELVAGQCRDLRQRGGVAEGVRQPGLAGLDPEVVQEEPLAGDELAGHRLRAGQVGVGLDPHPADGHEAPRGDVLTDPIEQLGVVVLDPAVLLRGGGREDQLRIALQQRADVGEGAGDLADGLTHRPQPGRVDVGVPGGQRRQRRGGGRALERGAQRPTGGSGGAGQVIGIGEVARALQGTQDLVAALGGGGQLAHQPGERPDILGELPDLHIASRQVQRRDRVQLLLGQGVRVAQRGGPEAPSVRDVRVRGAFEVEVQLLPGLHRQVAVVGVDRLDRHPVGGEHQRFGLEAGLTGEVEVDEQLGRGGLVVSPLSGDGAAHVQPDGRPGSSQRGAELDRLPLVAQLGDRLARRDRFTGQAQGSQAHRGGLLVDVRDQVVLDEAADPRFGGLPVVEHE